MNLRSFRPAFFTAALVAAADLFAAPLVVNVSRPAAPSAEGFLMGAPRSPAGDVLTVDTYSLRLNGRPWTPVMGEFHYSRYPENEWRDELLKIRAGGVSVLATYVFWSHHEEQEGEWNWSGRRDLRTFIKLAGEAGLKVIVRCGPWCHGEVRNGGIPDWAITSGLKVRTQDPAFMAKARLLYAQIAAQVKGQLWKEGGPVVGVQVDNEYGGPAEYLLELKTIARDVGLDVPLYTRTGWPALRTPMPFGEILPLYGSYAEGFWDREVTAMPGRYWAAFRFSTLRTDENIANEQLGRSAKDAPDVARYPYLTCEIGGGMMSSYHRRIRISPADVESTTLIKVGSGSTLPGYYMYHGGTNPEGRTTLMEAQDTLMTNWNDMPVKNYDFQAPLGEFGQIRPSYHRQRRLHLFFDDFGPALAGMPPTLPALVPQGRDDATTLRWVVRSDGDAGYVFVSNHERGRVLAAKPGVQFTVNLPGGALTFPDAPITVPADALFFWPFNLDLGHGVKLDWASAQPLATIDDGNVRTVFFAETPGVESKFAVAGGAPKTLRPGRAVAERIAGKDGASVRIVVLSEADSLALWKADWQGRSRVFLTEAGLLVDGAALRLVDGRAEVLSVGVYPAPAALTGGKADGVFTRFTPAAPAAFKAEPRATLLQAAGPAREIPLGKAPKPVATHPTDADFALAATWRITLPPDLDLAADPILRVRYTGDVARLMIDGKLVADDFFNGNNWEIGVRRLAPDILTKDVRLLVLPLRKDAIEEGAAKKIYLAEADRPDFRGEASVARLEGLELVPRYEARLSVPK